MSFDYVRDYYRVPARKGVRVEYTGGETPKAGTIVGVKGAYIMVKLDGQSHAGPYHPTWEIRYLNAECEARP